MDNIYKEMDDIYTFVPHHMRDAYRLWIEHGISPGSFGWAVITNNLKEAFARADEVNSRHLQTTVAWFVNHAPSVCWGSVERANQWQLEKAGDLLKKRGTA